MSTRLVDRWAYSNVVPRGEVYVDADDLFLIVGTTRTPLRLDHPVYHVTSLGAPDFFINMNDGTYLTLNVNENPEPDVDKILFRIPKNSVRFELKESGSGSRIRSPELLTNALKYNGSYTASTTAVQGKWGFDISPNNEVFSFKNYTSSYNLNCYVFDEFRPFVMYYNGFYMIFYDTVAITHAYIQK